LFNEDKIIKKDSEFNCHNCGSPKTRICLVCHLNEEIEINKETATELLKVLGHQYIDYEYTLVHSLIRELQKFVEKK
jgi:hypothetical protein